MGSGVRKMYVGAFTGTGSEFDVEKVGFRPNVVELFNEDELCFMRWTETMGDAALAIQKDATTSKVTTAGITPIANGFTVGTNADLNTSGELVHFVAYGY